jgi:Ca2+-binding RTX toxin-like protein
MINRPIRRPTSVFAVAFLLVTSFFAIGPPARAAKPRCFDEKATIVAEKGQKFVAGTNKADVIVGNNARNIIRGKGGADLICAFGGNDKVLGQGGAFDLIDGGGGKDKLNGGKGTDDFVVGNDGNDTVNGGPGGLDFLLGLAGDDTLIGGGGGFDTASFADAPSGVSVDLNAGTAIGEGNDTLIGIGDIYGSEFDDSLRGDENPDGNGFYPLAGNDSVDGGGGPLDILFHPLAAGPLTIDLTLGTANGEGTDTLLDIDDVYGSPAEDVMTGSDGPNFLVGFEGSDQLTGGAGDDLLDGDFGPTEPFPGTDTLDGGDGIDRCVNGETLAGCEETTFPPQRARWFEPGRGVI